MTNIVVFIDADFLTVHKQSAFDNVAGRIPLVDIGQRILEDHSFNELHAQKETRADFVFFGNTTTIRDLFRHGNGPLRGSAGVVSTLKWVSTVIDSGVLGLPPKTTKNVHFFPCRTRRASADLAIRAATHHLTTRGVTSNMVLVVASDDVGVVEAVAALFSAAQDKAFEPIHRDGNLPGVATLLHARPNGGIDPFCSIQDLSIPTFSSEVQSRSDGVRTSNLQGVADGAAKPLKTFLQGMDSDAVFASVTSCSDGSYFAGRNGSDFLLAGAALGVTRIHSDEVVYGLRGKVPPEIETTAGALRAARVAHAIECRFDAPGQESPRHFLVDTVVPVRTVEASLEDWASFDVPSRLPLRRESTWSDPGRWFRGWKPVPVRVKFRRLREDPRASCKMMSVDAWWCIAHRAGSETFDDVRVQGVEAAEKTAIISGRLTVEVDEVHRDLRSHVEDDQHTPSPQPRTSPVKLRPTSIRVVTVGVQQFAVLNPFSSEIQLRSQQPPGAQPLLWAPYDKLRNIRSLGRPPTGSATDVRNGWAVLRQLPLWVVTDYFKSRPPPA